MVAGLIERRFDLALISLPFEHSILPDHALRGNPRFFHMYRVPGHRISRQQALATARTDHPRALTESIAQFLQTTLTGK